MENKRNKTSSKVENDTPKKLSYVIDSTRNLDLLNIENNKPAYDKENNKYSLITFLSSKRKPDFYINDNVIKAKHYRIPQIKEEDTNQVQASDEESTDIRRMEQRYFNVNLTIKCYNCGEVGHMSRNCPHDEIIICTRCNERGHDSFNCTNMKCFKCNRIGHRSYECKLRDIKTCEKCGHNGHIGADCLSKPDSITDMNLRVCRFCSDDKHLICLFPRKMYIIQDYDSDNVIFSDADVEEPSVKRKRKREKTCPRCGGDHLMDRCKMRQSDNSFDKFREQFKKRENENYNYNRYKKREYKSDSEDYFLNFKRNQQKRRDDFRFNHFK